MEASNLTWDYNSEDLQSESITVIQWHGFFSILLITFCCALSIISTAGKSLIIYHVRYKAPKRPMNTMILLDQSGLLITSLVTQALTIISLITATSILDLYGPLACDFYFLITVTHNALLITGGLTMALFRLICIQFQGYFSSMENLMVNLMWIQYGLAACIMATTWLAADIYGSVSLYEFCRGYTTKMAHVLMQQTEENKALGKQALQSLILMVQAFIVLELICYMIIYWSLRKQDKSIIKFVQEDVLKKRAKKNAITFTGQVITFIVEVTYSMLMQVLIHYGTVGGFFEPGALPCALMVVMAAIPSSEILTSPELRRFIFD